MNENPQKRPFVFTPAKLIFIGVTITLAAILSIQYFLGDRPQEESVDARFYYKSSSIFKTEPAGEPAIVYNPARRPESAPGADSLKMFTRTNAGYSKAYEAETAGPAAAAPRQGKPAAAKRARKKVLPKIRP